MPDHYRAYSNSGHRGGAPMPAEDSKMSAVRLPFPAAVKTHPSSIIQSACAPQALAFRQSGMDTRPLDSVMPSMDLLSSASGSRRTRIKPR